MKPALDNQNQRLQDQRLPRVQIAAMPWRGAAKIEILLVSSRETRRWVLPKGWPMKGKSMHEAAACEAMEEAGVEGAIATSSGGFYHYKKRMKDGATERLRVDVFALWVSRELKSWPEKDERTRRWFSIEEAAAAVEEPELQALIRAVAASILAGIKAAQLA